jgi:hypothetical protein
MIDPWPADLRAMIEVDMGEAVTTSCIKANPCPIRQNSTNQSVGNQVESFAVAILAPHLKMFRLAPCPGNGYPDKMLENSATNALIPLEMKATARWDSSDSNRRVLTSSTAKLRTVFQAPIHHLLLTIIFTPQPNGVLFDVIRLDFLEPESPVTVRLEASVSHRLLAESNHHSGSF